MKIIKLWAMFTICCVFIMTVSGCNNNKVINGKVCQTYGFANQSENIDPDVVYELSTGSIIVAVIFSETIIIPLYIAGWDLFQPVGPKYVRN